MAAAEQHPARMPYLLALAGTAVGVGALLLADAPWIGALLLGVTALGAAVVRLAVPDRAAGWLAVRRRRVDVAFTGLLGSLFLAAAVWLFLKD